MFIFFYSDSLFGVFTIILSESLVWYYLFVSAYSLHIRLIFLYVDYVCFFKIVLKLRRDVEENDGPKTSSRVGFSICH